jgi:hypothetical protein
VVATQRFTVGTILEYLHAQLGTILEWLDCRLGMAFAYTPKIN